ncbi:hypothetical protein B0H13DRAFT_2267426 [Mycena leptocephala]|nr:hypothetical protein B0H13DRAFT_2275377 [Mycena leptocephala]KAJ7922699.1 hypothetical protein B0H13DRAFT_2267426 [Mycena leptocephala]
MTQRRRYTGPQKLDIQLTGGTKIKRLNGIRATRIEWVSPDLLLQPSVPISKAPAAGRDDLRTENFILHRGKTVGAIAVAISVPWIPLRVQISRSAQCSVRASMRELDKPPPAPPATRRVCTLAPTHQPRSAPKQVVHKLVSRDSQSTWQGAFKPPAATGWLFRHAVPGGYVIMVAVAVAAAFLLRGSLATIFHRTSMQKAILESRIQLIQFTTLLKVISEEWDETINNSGG